jgi:hypothetical protein
MLLRAAGGEAGAEACVQVLARPRALLDMLNESQALSAVESEAAPAMAPTQGADAASAEDAVEQWLYEAQEVVVQPRRRAAELPRV